MFKLETMESCSCAVTFVVELRTADLLKAQIVSGELMKKVSIDKPQF